MKLLTKEILKNLPDTLAQRNKKDPIAYVKFFLPTGRWTWYLTGMDSDQDYCFGYCLSGIDEDFDEYGYFSLNELREIRVFGLGIERDRYFKPTRMSEILKKK